MITNLFSIFDPSTALLSQAWLLLMFAPALLPLSNWNTTCAIPLLNNNITLNIQEETNFTLNNTSNSQQIFLMSAFILITTLNVTALYPQVFSLTSHLTITLPLSITFWLTTINFGWTNNTHHILSHLLPQGTPVILTPFIVLIETTSNIIRPITLCIRLTANLIAGHLLMTLLGSGLLLASHYVTGLATTAPIILTILETAVALIQSYVFITLITLYITEIN